MKECDMYFFKFAPPVRQGAADAFKLPSLVSGKLVYPRAPQPSHPLCVEVV